MNSSIILYIKQRRLAQHYLEKLRVANRTYQLGGENMAYGLKLVEQDWAQIRHWHAWAVTSAAQYHEAALLCSAYPYEAGELLELTLTPHEQRAWNEIALTHAQQHGAQRAELAHQLALGEICYKLDEYAQSHTYITHALRIAHQINDQHSIGRALITLGYISRYTGKFADSRRYFEDSLAIYHTLQDETGIATSLLGLGRALHYLGDRKTACSHAEESLRRFRSIGDRRGIAYALLALGSSSLAAGCTEIPISYLQEGLQLFRKIGDRRGTADMLCWLSQAFDLHGDCEAAQAFGEESVQVYQDLNSPGGITAILGNLAYMWLRRGNLDTARSYYEQSLEIGRQIDNVWLTGRNLYYLGLIAGIERDYATALEYAQKGLDFEQKRGDQSSLFNTYLLVAYAHIGLNDTVRARINLLSALTYAPVADLNILLQWVFLAAWLLFRMNAAEKSCLLFGLIEKHQHSVLRLEFMHDGLPLLRKQLETILGEATFNSMAKNGSTLDFDAAFAQTVADLSR